MLVVADSSQLIYLSRVGVLHILPTLFGDVVVPRAVWQEVAERRPSAAGIRALHEAAWLRVVDTPSPSADLGLDPAETAAILLAESHADLLLIDERVGRAVAQERRLTVRATLGVLVQARESSVLPALKPVLDALVAEGFRIAPALVRQALEHVGEVDQTGGP